MIITELALSTVFRKLPFDLIPLVLKNHIVLAVMNDYAQQWYGDTFWLGNINFNPDYRLVYGPNKFFFDLRLGFPFFCKVVTLERVPFTEGKNYAKFGLNPRLIKPLEQG